MENYSIKRMNESETLPNKLFKTVLQILIFYTQRAFQVIAILKGSYQS